VLLSIVIPVYNETDALPELLPALRAVVSRMECDYELLFVNDGSSDDTMEVLAQAAMDDPRIKVVGFSRNFGHQVAVTAGLDFASGDAVVVMDADLQDPPELLPQMVALYREGYHVVSAQRSKRKGDNLFKRATAAVFYWIMRKMVDPRLQPDVGDFRLFSRGAVLAVRRFRERHRFMRGLVAWLGLREAILPFERQARVAGETKYPLWKMLRFAWTAVASFSALPLRLTISCGMIIAGLGILYALYSTYEALVLHHTVPGWTSLICLVTIFSGAILLAIGLVGDYVARIFEEAKGRPLYIVSNLRNLVEPDDLPERALVVENMRRSPKRRWREPDEQRELR
jgi:dolichol-phosphate mannosyltransferase